VGSVLRHGLSSFESPVPVNSAQPTRPPQGAHSIRGSTLHADLHTVCITEREITVLLADFATVWNELFPAEQARIVQLLVERVNVREDALEVRIRAEGLASLVGELRQQSERMAA